MAFLAREKKNGSAFQYPLARERDHSRPYSLNRETLAVRSKPEGTVKTVSLKKNFYNARSLQENNARSAINQSARTIVAI